jgi:hypothetical protein
MLARQEHPVKVLGRAASRSGKERRAERQQRQVRRAAHQGRHPRPRRKAAYRAWRRLTRDQRAVAARLTAGQVELVTVSGWGVVGRWLTFLDELGYLGLLDIKGAGYRRVMIPLARLLLTYQVKALLGIASINLVPTRLFRDLALLKLIGYTTAQIAAGFCRRGELAAGPMHQNTLSDAIERLSAEEVETLLNATVKRLVARGFFRASQGHFALDASDLETTRRYLGAGMTECVNRFETDHDERLGKRGRSGHRVRRQRRLAVCGRAVKGSLRCFAP